MRVYFYVTKMLCLCYLFYKILFVLCGKINKFKKQQKLYLRSELRSDQDPTIKIGPQFAFDQNKTSNTKIDNINYYNWR